MQIFFSLLQATTILNHQIKDDKPLLHQAPTRDEDPHTNLVQPQHIQHKHYQIYVMVDIICIHKFYGHLNKKNT